MSGSESDSDMVVCEWDGCDREYGEERWMKYHYATTHNLIHESVGKFACKHKGCGRELETEREITLHYAQSHCFGNYVLKVCNNCDGKYFVLERKKESSEFCSEECGDEAWGGMMYICRNCGKKGNENTFYQSHKPYSYCTESCRYDDLYKVYECGWCGSMDRIRTSKLKNIQIDALLCSRCWEHENDFKTPFIGCDNCGDYFKFEYGYWNIDKVNFCSPSCEREFLHIICNECGEDYYCDNKSEARNRRFCSDECKHDHQVGKDHPAWKGGYHEYDYGPSWTEQLRESIRKSQDRQCLGCGVDESELDQRLDVHHIKKARTFDDHEKANDPDNLVALCRGCHQQWEKMSPLKPQTNIEETVSVSA